MPLTTALFELSERLRMLEGHSGPAQPSSTLALDWPELDAALPDGGLPRGVTELASDRAIGITAPALAAIRAAHGQDTRAWCAWVEVGDSLYAPGVAQSGVDLARLLVVRPPVRDAAKVSVRVATSGAFEVVVVDAFAFVDKSSRRGWPSDVFVRKLSLAAETHGVRIVLLSDSSAPRAMSWPVALRLEIERTPAAMLVRVAKDRHGRLGLKKTRVPWASRPALVG